MNRRVLKFRVASLDDDGLEAVIEERARGQPTRRRIVRLNPRDVLNYGHGNYAEWSGGAIICHRGETLTPEQIILRLVATAETQEQESANA